MILTVVTLVWMHFFADFMCQWDKMAISKSSSNKWLSLHVTIYAAPFLILCGWQFAAVNFAAHWVTDFVTSRAASALWKRNERHWFFVVIGVDQAIHMSCLILTIPLIHWLSV